MTPLPAREMVRLWERARGQHPIDRALTLLETADPSTQRSDLEVLWIGDRDRRLFEFRREIFGDGINAEGECPACGQRVEIAASATQLVLPGPDEANPSSVTVEVEGLEFEIRPATSRDLAAAAVCDGVDEARRKLLERCVVRVDSNHAAIALSELPDTAASEISRVLSELDPQADIEFDLLCPQCSETWRQSFDIGDFLWGELVARARRLLYEIHILAWAYGWSETEILSLSDARRCFYLERVEQWQTT